MSLQSAFRAIECEPRWLLYTPGSGSHVDRPRSHAAQLPRGHRTWRHVTWNKTRSVHCADHGAAPPSPHTSRTPVSDPHDRCDVRRCVPTPTSPLGCRPHYSEDPCPCDGPARFAPTFGQGGFPLWPGANICAHACPHVDDRECRQPGRRRDSPFGSMTTFRAPQTVWCGKRLVSSSSCPRRRSSASTPASLAQSVLPSLWPARSAPSSYSDHRPSSRMSVHEPSRACRMKNSRPPDQAPNVTGPPSTSPTNPAPGTG